MPDYLRDQYNADGSKKLGKKDFDAEEIKRMKQAVND